MQVCIQQMFETIWHITYGGILGAAAMTVIVGFRELRPR